MVLMNLKLNNILCFKNFEVNFSYPSKLTKSTILNEHLKNIPSFRYKKLIVLIGSNASGKTSLIKVIWHTLVFLSNSEKTFFTNLINMTEKESYIELDLAEDTKTRHFLHRIKIKSHNVSNNGVEITISHTYVKLSAAKSSKDSYENKVKELDLQKDNFIDYVEAINSFDFKFGWNTILPATERPFDIVTIYPRYTDEQRKQYKDILESILKVFDPSIKSVDESNDAENAFVLTLENVPSKIIVQHGMNLATIPYLSSGTKYAINIANMMYCIKNHMNGMYLLDEQFSYVDSDIEAAILSEMVSSLKENEQIFFATHNKGILSLSFPFHSFYFLKKKLVDDSNCVEIFCGQNVENRNNVSPRTIIDNDIFAITSDLSPIFNLGGDNNG